MKLNQELLEFIKKSPTAYQAVDSVKKMLSGTDCHITTRNGTSLIAYRIPQYRPKGFHIICAHTDSPMFKIKENAESKDGNGYTKINVEKYGGMIVNTWMDRPLSVAGRVVYEADGELVSVNVDLEEPMYIIPNLAIHMSRGSEDKPLSIQTDLQPIGDEGLLETVTAKMCEITGKNIQKENILGTDLYVYNCQEGVAVGGKQSLLCAPRLDDLQCVFAAAKAFVSQEGNDYVNILAVFDNEEVGSLSRQGAASDYLKNVLEEIAEELELSGKEYRCMLENSIMISADNAHAVHPNHPQKADPTNKPHMNEGIVIKYHGAQKYTTDAYTGAYIKKLCKDNGIQYQTYHNNSDVAGGSTLGNLVMANVSIPAVDIGAPQLAMHSAFETTGALDTENLCRLMKVFYKN
ncbi:MAG: M18 family aminopeptidase [Lachnospira sp.]|nr:M18 family aminopeptidase [Lachnospira sp.]